MIYHVYVFKSLRIKGQVFSLLPLIIPLLHLGNNNSAKNNTLACEKND
jgi:hypothetical protein